MIMAASVFVGKGQTPNCIGKNEFELFPLAIDGDE